MCPGTFQQCVHYLSGCHRIVYCMKEISLENYSGYETVKLFHHKEIAICGN